MGPHSPEPAAAAAPVDAESPAPPLSELPVPLERDIFLRTLLRHLAGTLQDVVGLQEASGFISVVGQKMGEEIGNSYLRALGVSTLNRQQVTNALVDLKRRIQGDFFVVEEHEDRLVLGNRACPFGELVVGRPALCMMTSNVFGHIAAQNLGYARVELKETIARGDRGCHIIVYLEPAPESAKPEEREYFHTVGGDSN
jgi:predicted ArsR family transcriptional regulator